MRKNDRIRTLLLLKKGLFLAAMSLMSLRCMNEEAVKQERTTINTPSSGSGLLGYQDASCQAIGLPPPQSQALALTAQGAEFIEIAENFVGAQNGWKANARLESLLQFTTSGSAGARLAEEEYSQAVTIDYEIEGIPLCGHSIRVVQTGNTLVKFGETPAQNFEDMPIKAADLNWPDLRATLKIVEDEMQQQGFLSKAPLSELSPEVLQRSKGCLGWQENSLQPFWQLKFTYEEKNYFAIANNKSLLQDKYGKVLEIEEFHTSGQGKVQTKTGSDTTGYTFTITEAQFSDLSKSGFLCNSRFVTDRAYSPTRNFSFSFNDPDRKLADVTIFNNAILHSDWFKTLPAFTSWPGQQIRLAVDLTQDGLNNTAVYLPATTGGIPTIKLGNGDGKQLANLWSEPEVVSHELGHHLVYKTLTSTRSGSESIVLHEGIADFFVMARTKNPCLGETICPVSSSICLSKSCLRSADNTLRYDSSDLPQEGHKQSQLISATLWDLGKKLGFEITANILVVAIRFFGPNSGFEDFFVALMTADKSLNKGANACTIYTTAISRGFQTVLNEVDCQKFK